MAFIQPKRYPPPTRWQEDTMGMRRCQAQYMRSAVNYQGEPGIVVLFYDTSLTDGSKYRYVWLSVERDKSVEFAEQNQRGAIPGPVWEVSQSDGSTAYIAATDDGSNIHLERCTSIGGAWTDELTTTAGTGQTQYPLCLIDCGSGRLFYVTYAGGSDTLSIYYSNDGGANWGDNGGSWDDGDALIQMPGRDVGDGGPIHHFHGGRYDADEDVLYLFTGDASTGSDNECGILVCRDIWTNSSGLIYSPTTWRGRWVLEVVMSMTTGTDNSGTWTVGDTVKDNDTGSVWTGVLRSISGTAITVGLDAGFTAADVDTADGINNTSQVDTDTLSAASEVARDTASADYAGYHLHDHLGERHSGYLRTLMMEFQSTGWGVWASDDEVHAIMRVDRQTGEVQKLGSITGLCYGGTKVGDLVVCTGRTSHNGTVYTYGSDAYMRLYAVTGEGRVYQVGAYERYDSAGPSNGGLAPRWIGNAAGRVFLGLSDNEFRADPLRGLAGPIGRLVPVGGPTTIQTDVTPTNQVWAAWDDDTITNLEATGPALGDNGLLDADGNALTNDDNLTVTPTATIPSGCSAPTWKLYPDGSTAGASTYFRWTFSDGGTDVDACDDGLVTASVWLYLPSAAPAGQQSTAKLALYPDQGSTWGSCEMGIAGNLWDDDWHLLTITGRRPASATGAIRIEVYPGNAASAVPVEMNTPSCVPGGLADVYRAVT